MVRRNTSGGSAFPAIVLFSLVVLAVPADAQFDTVINLPGTITPPSASENTQINVFTRGKLPTGFSPGFQLGNASIDSNNSELNVLGGSVSGLTGITANSGTLLNMESGVVEGGIRLMAGSEASFSGGSYRWVEASDGASVTLSGGWLNSFALSGLKWDADASVTVVGGDFWLNDQFVESSGPGSITNLDISTSDIVSGKFADGRPFAINNPGLGIVFPIGEGGVTPLESSTISLRVADELTPPQRIFDFPGDDDITQIGAGQTAIFANNPLTSGTFTALPGSRVEIGLNAKVQNVDSYAAAVEMSGGSLWGARVYRNSEFRITGGSTLGNVRLQGGSRLTVLGGGRTGLWVADSETEQRWDDISTPSEIQLIGTEFSTRTFTPEITAAIQQLSQPGDSYVIERRAPLDDGTEFIVDATLMDGRTIDWELSETRLVPDGPFSFKDEIVVNEQAIARITIGFPDGYCDFNGSETCDLGDIDALRSMFGSGDRHFDLTYDGVVDDEDVQQLLMNGFGGDANLDGVVDGADLNIVALNWRSTDVADWSTGDFDGDGRVGSSDLNIVGINWWRGVVAAPVPEPSTYLSAILTILILFGRRNPG